MIAALLAMAMQTPPAASATEPEPQEIVVRAKRRKCWVEVDRRSLSNAEFDRRAKAWQGKPVRVVAPSSADIECLSKVAFRLARRGVRLIHFVDPRDEHPATQP